MGYYCYYYFQFIYIATKLVHERVFVFEFNDGNVGFCVCDKYIIPFLFSNLNFAHQKLFLFCLVGNSYICNILHLICFFLLPFLTKTLTNIVNVQMHKTKPYSPINIHIYILLYSYCCYYCYYFLP